MLIKTISTHNGSKAHQAHNRRDSKVALKEKHIDPALLRFNETLVDEQPRQAYERLFGSALVEYNAKQKRTDRRISDYFEHISKDEKKHPVYEMIVQIGNRNNTGIDFNATQTERQILHEFIDGWKARNPNLELIGAYIHADEREWQEDGSYTTGTIYAHLDYIPVATGYKNGLSVQNGLTKALEQQGMQKGKSIHETPQILWERAENAVLEHICNAHGIEVEHPMRDGEEKRGHEATAQYKINQELRESGEQVQSQYEYSEELKSCNNEISDKIKRKANRVDSLEGQIETLQAEVSSLKRTKKRLMGEVKEAKDFRTKKGQIAGGKKIPLSDSVILPLTALADLQHTAKQVDRVKAESAKIRADTAKQVEEADQRVKQAERSASAARSEYERKVRSLEAREKDVSNRENIAEKAIVENKNVYVRTLEEVADRYSVSTKDGSKKSIKDLAEDEFEEITQSRGFHR